MMIATLKVRVKLIGPRRKSGLNQRLRTLFQGTYQTSYLGNSSCRLVRAINRPNRERSSDRTESAIVLISVKTIAFGSTEPIRDAAVSHQSSEQQTFYRSSIRRAWRGIVRPIGRLPVQGRQFWCHRYEGFRRFLVVQKKEVTEAQCG